MPGRKLYRTALLLLPEHIRAKHGESMERLFVRDLDRARERGILAWLSTLVRGLWDVARRGWYERWRSRDADQPGPGGGSLGADVIQDARYAARSLRKDPRFALLVIVTLALGIGSNTALFSVIRGVVLRPLPFPDHERVVHLAWDRGRPVSHVPGYKVSFWEERSRSFEAVTTWRQENLAVGPESDEQEVSGLRVSDDFLEVLGWEPVLGRDFDPSDDRPGAPDVAILGHDFWRTAFDGDVDVIGRTLRIEGSPHTVVGVLPPDFAFPQAPEQDDLLVPLRLEPDPTDEAENYPILARLRSGVDEATASADLERVTAAFFSEHPELQNGNDRGMVLSSFREIHVGGVGTTLWVLAGATGLVLLIACANVAALMLARGTGRRTELAVRTALGAGRGRLVRQVLTESLLIATLASILGIGLAELGVDVLLGAYPGTLPREAWIGLDWTVVLYAVGAALGTGLLFGLAAALPALRSDATAELRGGRRGASRTFRLRKLLLAGEASVSVVLLVGAGLLIATLGEIRSLDAGFDPENVVTASVPAPPGGFASIEERRTAAERILEEVRRIPGVRAATLTTTYPLRRGLNIPVGIEGRPDAFEGAVEWRAVTPGYLETLGVELVAGRALRDSDARDAPSVALVNRAFVERWLPDRNPVGATIEIGRYRDRYVAPGLDVGGTRIVGVVEDVREISLKEEARRTVIVPLDQVPEVLARPPVLVVRHEGSAAVASVRRVLAGATPAGSPPELTSLTQVISESLARERFNAILMSVFAAVALVLTALGIYGVVSYGVRQRRREIGIRIALGAGSGRVARQVVGDGVRPVLLGLVLGGGLALLLARYIEGLLWGVQPADPETLGGVVVVLTLVALAASWLPVREATRTEPQRVLRTE